MYFAQATAENGEILGEDIHKPTVDRSPAGDHAIRKVSLLIQGEIIRPVGDKHIRFDKRIGV